MTARPWDPGAAHSGGTTTIDHDDLTTQVPVNAKDVVAWIDGDEDKARAAALVEQSRSGAARATVTDAITAVLG